MTLDVVVSDRTGKAMDGLGLDDFKVFDNGEQVTALSTLADTGVQTMLLLDAINTTYESFGRAKDAIEELLRASGGHLPRPVSILILSDQKPQGSDAGSVMALKGKQAFVRRIPASQDGLTLIKDLDRSLTALSRILESQGSDGQVERVQLSLQALDFIATAEATTPGRKLLIWISPGWPLLASSTSKTDEQMFDTVIYFSDLLRRARIMLDTVNPEGMSSETLRPAADPRSFNPGRFGASASTSLGSGPVQYEDYYKGVKTAKQANANDLALQVLAHQSGGFVLDHNNAIALQLARCMADAALAYSFSYAPEGMGYHEVTVRATRPTLIARTRAGFYIR